MPDQLFAFVSEQYDVFILIGARDETKARLMLECFLVERPQLPAKENWRLQQIACKLDYGIFSLTPYRL